VRVDAADLVRIEQVDRDVVVEGDHGQVFLHDDPLGLAQDLHPPGGIRLGAGLVEQVVVDGVVVLAIVVPVGRSVDLEERCGVAVVGVPPGAADHVVLLLQIVAINLEFLLRQAHGHAQVPLPVLGHRLGDQVVPRVLVEQDVHGGELRGVGPPRLGQERPRRRRVVPQALG
jgi:hypothetical protein